MSIRRRSFLRSLAALPYLAHQPGLRASALGALNSASSTQDKLFVLNPCGEHSALLRRPAPRLATLAGKRVGLYIARRANAFELMGRIAENLRSAYPDLTILGGAEGTVWAKKAYDRAGNIGDLMAQRPDAVILGISS
jgi:hypothetical protein